MFLKSLNLNKINQQIFWLSDVRNPKLVIGKSVTEWEVKLAIDHDVQEGGE
jgi:hypothetical protein